MHEEALARIAHLVDFHRRLGLLVGEPGTGKSIVLGVAAEDLARGGCQVATVDATGLSTREFFSEILRGLRIPSGCGDDALRLWQRIADRIYENRMQQIATVLLVDDAGQARPDVLTQVQRLARLDRDPRSRWTIILAAVPGQLMTWSDTLIDMVDLRIDLTTWDYADTVGFIHSALIDAGRDSPMFTDDGLSALHELAGGIPRQLARIADAALVAGATARSRVVDSNVVRDAYEESSWALADRVEEI
jgi:general secretion pathway protein A